ncbi:uncharacterized protein PG986_011095 [Apiospora aurea]|uniref:Uracil permease n=1 Tax=Apiospora aurea TaxID=335848 RepID=A0ABR1Q434_9PEZI
MEQPKIQSRMSRWAKKLECPVDKDANYKNTFWCNRDLIPIPEDRRTWTWQGFAGYWVICGINTSAWTAGASLLSLGLSATQAIGCVVGVALIAALVAVLAGWPGSHLYLGFTVLSRASWGMRGGFWPVLNRIMTACVWMGIQAYWGGQAVKIILRAIIGVPFVALRNTLPATASTDTASLVSFFVFIVVFLPLPMIPPEKLQLPFRITFVMITATLFGMLGWSVHTAGGAGALMSTPSTLSGSALSWNAVYGLQSFLGAQASGCLGQSDWTRYARHPNSALFGQAVTAPIFIVVTAVCGIIITSAAATIYGEYIWNPLELLLTIQDHSLSPVARAGTFFAGLGFLTDQLALCQMLNGISTGMDMAALCPKWINIRRGCYILTVIAIVILPWNYVTNPGTFITVLSGWSVFISPMTGIVVSDYFLVRRGAYHIGDLYLGDSRSAYWYTCGFNFRAFIAWALGTGPLLPGFVRAIQVVSSSDGWDHLYQISYIYGFTASLVIYASLYTVFPQERQRGTSPFMLELHAEMIGSADRESDLEASGRVPDQGEKCVKSCL